MDPMVSEGVSLQKKDLAQRHAREFRPTKKFSGNSISEFRHTMTRFQMAVENVGMDSRMKLLEMQHWFEGYPAKIVAAYVTERCADTGYAKAMSELHQIFGGTADSVIPLIEQLVAGKQIGENDLEAHLQFLSELLVVDATTQQMDKRGKLDESDRLARIVDARLKYYAKTYYSLDFDLRRESAEGFDFDRLKDVVKRQIGILQQTNIMRGNQQQLKVNSTATAPQQQQQQKQQQGKKSYSKALTESPKKIQSTDSCNICKGMHTTDSCNQLLKVDVQKRDEFLKPYRLCFHCLEPGHVARFCKNIPSCGTCGKPHNTLFHGKKMAKKELNVHATSFKHPQGQQVDTSRGLLEANPQVGRQPMEGELMGYVTPNQDSTQSLTPNQLPHPQANLNQGNL